jgi:hypothetical protein
MAPPRFRVRFPVGMDFQDLGSKTLSLCLARSRVMSHVLHPPTGPLQSAVVAGPLVMGDQGSGIFSVCVSRPSTSNATPQGWSFPRQVEFLFRFILE